MAPIVSIILPVFNAESHIQLLLSSLLNQSESSIEIVAVDDGSTDRSAEILQQAAARDPRVRAFFEPNRGPSATRNVGLLHARGTWIAFPDSDDWLDADLIKTWFNTAVARELDMVVGNAFSFRDRPDEQPRTPLLKFQPWDEVISGEEWIIRGSTGEEWPHQVWLQLVRKELLDRLNLRFIDDLVHEDIPWTLKLALGARRVGFISTPLYGYRTNPTSLTRSRSVLAITRRIRSYLRIVPLLASASDQAGNAMLRKSLMHVAHTEGLKCLSLIRKRLPEPRSRAEAARFVLRSGLIRTTFRGAGNAGALWRATRGFLRCWYVVIIDRLAPIAGLFAGKAMFEHEVERAALPGSFTKR